MCMLLPCLFVTNDIFRTLGKETLFIVIVQPDECDDTKVFQIKWNL